MNPAKPDHDPETSDELRASRFDHEGEELVVYSLPLADPAVGGPTSTPWQALTQAQLEVVTLALEGRSNREIAALRETAASTVAKQLETAYRRLGINSRRELMVLAARRRPGPRRGG